MIPRMPYGEKYLDWYYNKGGMQTTILGLDSVGGENPFSVSKFAKAVGPWDAPTSPYGTYFEPVFSLAVHMYTARNTELEKLLPKTTWIAEGDSLKYWEADLAGLTGASGASTPFASGSAESAPTIASLEEFEPAYLVDPWETSLPSRTRATWQVQPKLDPAWIKQYHAENLAPQIDTMLNKTVDTVANDGSSNLDLESIDRIISSENESGAGTTYTSAATDGDIYWGKSSVLIDRSADTDETFGAGAGSGISLPSTGAARVLSLDYIDDVMAESKRYSKRKRYVGFTGGKTINEMQKLIDPKQRYLDSPMNVKYTMNGVETRPGAQGGFSVASFITNGISIPMFSSSGVANETSGNRSATVTDADIGNIYFIDLDAIEIRVAIPMTYMETPPANMLTGDVLKTRHMFLYGAQLLATNFRAHAAVKYLKST